MMGEESAVVKCVYSNFSPDGKRILKIGGSFLIMKCKNGVTAQKLASPKNKRNMKR